MARYKGEEIDLTPTEGMAEEAVRGLEWRKEFGRGGTSVGVARAVQLKNRQELSPDTVRRMVSFFARHEVDKQGEGFALDEDGYPSNGRIAWALWGGDAGQSWANAKDKQMDKIDEERGAQHEEKRPYPNEHAARITDPAQYDEFARDVDAGGPGIDFIYGIKEDTSELQAIRFDADRYTAAEAQLWLDEHDFSPIEFEEATMERSVQMTEETEDRFDRSEMQMRAFDMSGDKVIDEEKRLVRVGVSSEQPVKREFGLEVIDHRAGSMNLDFLNSGRAPLLLDHDMERQIGVVESVELDEDARRLRALVRFGKGALASEVFTDVVDGIRQNISVGYRIDGRIDEDNDPEEFYRVRTTPMEISIVSIPADQSSLVGVGRSNPDLLNATVKTEGDNSMSDIDLDAVRAEATKTAQRNAKDIMILARKHNKADLGEQAIGNGLTIDEFRGVLLDAIGNAPLDTPAHVVDAPVKQRREYSLSRMINAQLTHDWSKAGFEREMHEEIAARVGKQTDGFYVPDFAFRAGPMSAAATGASGSENVVDNFIPTIHRGDMFVEALRARQVMAGLGVTYMSGLTNRIKMPKFSAGANAGFVEELGNVADQSQTDAGVTLQPRTLGAYVDIGRIALKESIPSLDRVVQDDLLRSIADRIEYYAINGSGSSGQPTGIINAGVTSVDISAGTDVDTLTWADVVALVKAVENNNAVVNSATQGWLSSPAVKAKLASTAKVGSTDSVMLMNDPWTTLYGYPTAFTSNVLSTYDPGDGGNDASALIFGDWSQLLVGLFGAPSILVDETTGGLAGTVRIIVHQDVDIAFRHLQSFALTDEVSVA
jgi:HK97 family phage major capsid protein/HK97 family phage prohead protease